MTSLFESIWVSNLVRGLSKGRGSLLVNSSFLRYETTKFGSQIIMVKSLEVNKSPSFSGIVHCLVGTLALPG